MAAADDDAGTRYEAGRVVGFSDGVVAIAITLLILPLADIQLESGQLAELWDENSQLIIAYVISWLVIAQFWLAHHRTFGHIEQIDGTIMRWNLLWLFGIVLLPFPTSLLAQSPAGQVGPSRSVFALYIGNLLLCSIMLALISWHCGRNPRLLEPESRAMITPQFRYKALGISVSFLVILALAMIYPDWAYYYLLLLPAFGFLNDKVSARLSGTAAGPSMPDPPAGTPPSS